MNICIIPRNLYISIFSTPFLLKLSHNMKNWRRKNAMFWAVLWILLASYVFPSKEIFDRTALWVPLYKEGDGHQRNRFRHFFMRFSPYHRESHQTSPYLTISYHVSLNLAKSLHIHNLKLSILWIVKHYSNQYNIAVVNMVFSKYLFKCCSSDEGSILPLCILDAA